MLVTEHKQPLILVVDDVEAARYATARVLQVQGFDVLEAALGEEALEKALEKPDLILLDVNLPDISGFEVCKRLKSDPATKSIPVLHLSAIYMDTRAKVAGLEGGADGYLTQPVDPKELTATINALLRLKKAEEAAERQARHWQATFDAASDIIWVLDREQRILQSNRTAERFFGKPCEEFIGRRCWEIVHETSAPTPDCPILCAKQSLRRESMELPLGDRWFEVTVDPILDGEGRYTGAVHIVSDITARKQGEQAMAESLERERFLGNIIRAASVAIGVGYPDGALGMCNPAFRKLTGYSQEELKTIAWNTVLTPPEWLESEMQSLTELHRTKQPVVYEKEYIHKSGKRVPIELVVHPFFDGSGEVSHYYAFINDITERKHHQARIEHLNRVLRAIRDVNQLITQEKDRDALLRRSCRILIATRGYRSAWAALRGADGQAQTVAEYGIGDDFAPLRAALERGEWPDCCKQAWERPDHIATIFDTDRNCTTCSLGRTYRDTAALAGALGYGGHPYGVMVVALPKGLADDPEEQSLFRELIGDLSYALRALELDQEQQQAEAKLAEQLHEVKRWNAVMLDREDRVLELKQEVNELLARSGEPPRYPSALKRRENEP